MALCSRPLGDVVVNRTIVAATHPGCATTFSVTFEFIGVPIHAINI